MPESDSQDSQDQEPIYNSDEAPADPSKNAEDAEQEEQ